jgi:hypothetical protein
VLLGDNNTSTATDLTTISNPGFVLYPSMFLVDNYNNPAFVQPASSSIAVACHGDNGGGTPTTGTFYGLYSQSNPTAGGGAIGVFGLGGTVAAPGGIGVAGVGTIGVSGVGSGAGCGVDGTKDGASTVAFGVRGLAGTGLGGFFSGARGAAGLAPGAGAVANPNTTPPNGGSVGDLYCGSTNGSLWYNTGAANPYRRVGDATTAGQLTLLATPVRYVEAP